MNEKQIAKLIKNDILKNKQEFNNQYLASYYKVFNEPITFVKDINLLFDEANKIGIKIQYAEESPFKKDFKNDKKQTIIAYLLNENL